MLLEHGASTFLSEAAYRLAAQDALQRAGVAGRFDCEAPRCCGVEFLRCALHENMMLDRPSSPVRGTLGGERECPCASG